MVRGPARQHRERLLETGLLQLIVGRGDLDVLDEFGRYRPNETCAALLEIATEETRSRYEQSAAVTTIGHVGRYGTEHAGIALDNLRAFRARRDLDTARAI